MVHAPCLFHQQVEHLANAPLIAHHHIGRVAVGHKTIDQQVLPLRYFRLIEKLPTENVHEVQVTVHPEQVLGMFLVQMQVVEAYCVKGEWLRHTWQGVCRGLAKQLFQQQEQCRHE